MNLPEERVAFIQSQTVSALIAAMGMQAENQQRLRRGESIAYDEKAFNNVITEFGLQHNQVVEFLNGIIK